MDVPLIQSEDPGSAVLAASPIPAFVGTRFVPRREIPDLYGLNGLYYPVVLMSVPQGPLSIEHALDNSQSSLEPLRQLYALLAKQTHIKKLLHFVIVSNETLTEPVRPFESEEEMRIQDAYHQPISFPGVRKFVLHSVFSAAQLKELLIGFHRRFVRTGVWRETIKNQSWLKRTQTAETKLEELSVDLLNNKPRGIDYDRLRQLRENGDDFTSFDKSIQSVQSIEYRFETMDDKAKLPLKMIESGLPVSAEEQGTNVADAKKRYAPFYGLEYHPLVTDFCDQKDVAGLRVRLTRLTRGGNVVLGKVDRFEASKKGFDVELQAEANELVGVPNPGQNNIYMVSTSPILTSAEGKRIFPDFKRYIVHWSGESSVVWSITGTQEFKRSCGTLFGALPNRSDKSPRAWLACAAQNAVPGPADVLRDILYIRLVNEVSGTWKKKGIRVGYSVVLHYTERVENGSKTREVSRKRLFVSPDMLGNFEGLKQYLADQEESMDPLVAKWMDPTNIFVFDTASNIDKKESGPHEVKLIHVITDGNEDELDVLVRKCIEPIAPSVRKIQYVTNAAQPESVLKKGFNKAYSTRSKESSEDGKVWVSREYNIPVMKHYFSEKNVQTVLTESVDSDDTDDQEQDQPSKPKPEKVTPVPSITPGKNQLPANIQAVSVVGETISMEQYMRDMATSKSRVMPPPSMATQSKPNAKKRSEIVEPEIFDESESTPSPTTSSSKDNSKKRKRVMEEDQEAPDNTTPPVVTVEANGDIAAPSKPSPNVTVGAPVITSLGNAPVAKRRKRSSSNDAAPVRSPEPVDGPAAYSSGVETGMVTSGAINADDVMAVDEPVLPPAMPLEEAAIEQNDDDVSNDINLPVNIASDRQIDSIHANVTNTFRAIMSGQPPAPANRKALFDARSMGNQYIDILPKEKTAVEPRYIKCTEETDFDMSHMHISRKEEELDLESVNETLAKVSEAVSNPEALEALLSAKGATITQQSSYITYFDKSVVIDGFQFYTTNVYSVLAGSGDKKPDLIPGLAGMQSLIVFGYADSALWKSTIKFELVDDRLQPQTKNAVKAIDSYYSALEAMIKATEKGHPFGSFKNLADVAFVLKNNKPSVYAVKLNKAAKTTKVFTSTIDFDVYSRSIVHDFDGPDEGRTMVALEVAGKLVFLELKNFVKGLTKSADADNAVRKVDQSGKKTKEKKKKTTAATTTPSNKGSAALAETDVTDDEDDDDMEVDGVPFSDFKKKRKRPVETEEDEAANTTPVKPTTKGTAPKRATGTSASKKSKLNTGYALVTNEQEGIYIGVVNRALFSFSRGLVRYENGIAKSIDFMLSPLFKDYFSLVSDRHCEEEVVLRYLAVAFGALGLQLTYSAPDPTKIIFNRFDQRNNVISNIWPIHVVSLQPNAFSTLREPPVKSRPLLELRKNRVDAKKEPTPKLILDGSEPFLSNGDESFLSKLGAKYAQYATFYAKKQEDSGQYAHVRQSALPLIAFESFKTFIETGEIADDDLWFRSLRQAWENGFETMITRPNMWDSSDFTGDETEDDAYSGPSYVQIEISPGNDPLVKYQTKLGGKRSYLTLAELCRGVSWYIARDAHYDIAYQVSQSEFVPLRVVDADGYTYSAKNTADLIVTQDHSGAGLVFESDSPYGEHSIAFTSASFLLNPAPGSPLAQASKPKESDKLPDGAYPYIMNIDSPATVTVPSLEMRMATPEKIAKLQVTVKQPTVIGDTASSIITNSGYADPNGSLSWRQTVKADIAGPERVLVPLEEKRASICAHCNANIFKTSAERDDEAYDEDEFIDVFDYEEVDEEEEEGDGEVTGSGDEEEEEEEDEDETDKDSWRFKFFDSNLPVLPEADMFTARQIDPSFRTKLRARLEQIIQISEKKVPQDLKSDDEIPVFVDIEDDELDQMETRFLSFDDPTRVYAFTPTEEELDYSAGSVMLLTTEKKVEDDDEDEEDAMEVDETELFGDLKWTKAELFAFWWIDQAVSADWTYEDSFSNGKKGSALRFDVKEGWKEAFEATLGDLEKTQLPEKLKSIAKPAEQKKNKYSVPFLLIREEDLPDDFDYSVAFLQGKYGSSTLENFLTIISRLLIPWRSTLFYRRTYQLCINALETVVFKYRLVRIPKVRRIICPGCRCTAYCSDQCQEADSAAHAKECTAFKALVPWVGSLHKEIAREFYVRLALEAIESYEQNDDLSEQDKKYFDEDKMMLQEYIKSLNRQDTANRFWAVAAKKSVTELLKDPKKWLSNKDVLSYALNKKKPESDRYKFGRLAQKTGTKKLVKAAKLFLDNAAAAQSVTLQKTRADWLKKAAPSWQNRYYGPARVLYELVTQIRVILRMWSSHCEEDPQNPNDMQFSAWLRQLPHDMKSFLPATASYIQAVAKMTSIIASVNLSGPNQFYSSAPFVFLAAKAWRNMFYWRPNDKLVSNSDKVIDDEKDTGGEDEEDEDPFDLDAAELKTGSSDSKYSKKEIQKEMLRLLSVRSLFNIPAHYATKLKRTSLGVSILPGTFSHACGAIIGDMFVFTRPRQDPIKGPVPNATFRCVPDYSFAQEKEQTIMEYEHIFDLKKTEIETKNLAMQDAYTLGRQRNYRRFRSTSTQPAQIEDDPQPWPYLIARVQNASNVKRAASSGDDVKDTIVSVHINKFDLIPWKELGLVSLSDYYHYKQVVLMDRFALKCKCLSCLTQAQEFKDALNAERKQPGSVRLPYERSSRFEEGDEDNDNDLPVGAGTRLKRFLVNTKPSKSSPSFQPELPEPKQQEEPKKKPQRVAPTLVSNTLPPVSAGPVASGLFEATDSNGSAIYANQALSAPAPLASSSVPPPQKDSQGFVVPITPIVRVKPVQTFKPNFTTVQNLLYALTYGKVLPDKKPLNPSDRFSKDTAFLAFLATVNYMYPPTQTIAEGRKTVRSSYTELENTGLTSPAMAEKISFLYPETVFPDSVDGPSKLRFEKFDNIERVDVATSISSNDFAIQCERAMSGKTETNGDYTDKSFALDVAKANEGVLKNNTMFSYFSFMAALVDDEKDVVGIDETNRATIIPAFFNACALHERQGAPLYGTPSSWMLVHFCAARISEFNINSSADLAQKLNKIAAKFLGTFPDLLARQDQELYKRTTGYLRAPMHVNWKVFEASQQYENYVAQINQIMKECFNRDMGNLARQLLQTATFNTHFAFLEVEDKINAIVPGVTNALMVAYAIGMCLASKFATMGINDFRAIDDFINRMQAFVNTVEFDPDQILWNYPVDQQAKETLKKNKVLMHRAVYYIAAQLMLAGVRMIPENLETYAAQISLLQTAGGQASSTSNAGFASMPDYGLD